MNSSVEGAGKKPLNPSGPDRGETRGAGAAPAGAGGKPGRQPPSSSRTAAKKKTTRKKNPAETQAPANTARDPAVKKVVPTARTAKISGSRGSPAKQPIGAGRSEKAPAAHQRSHAKTPPTAPSAEKNSAVAGSSQTQARPPSVPSPRQGPRAPFRPAGLSEPRWNTLELPDQKAQLKRYYRGARMPSPMGGFLEPLRVRTEDDGAGTLILECSASSLRFALRIPAATRREKRTIKNSQNDGNDAVCPRHVPSQWLNRAGPYLVCPLCGVRYGRA